MLMTVQYGLLIALAIALLFAAFTDIRSRIISNWVNIAIAVMAPAFWWASGLSIWPEMVWQLGFALAVSGILIGIAFIGYKLNVVILGGGDIKLLGALSLWLAPLSYLSMLWVMALCGGALAIGFALYILVIKPKTKPRLPYGVPIAFGAFWVLTPALISVPTFA